MTKEMAEQLLNALNNREKDIRKNMKEEKGNPDNTKLKDW
jgi:hypothetical protein